MRNITMKLKTAKAMGPKMAGIASISYQISAILNVETNIKGSSIKSRLLVQNDQYLSSKGTIRKISFI